MAKFSVMSWEQIVRLAKQAEAVRALHHRDDSEAGWCEEDGVEWPCETARLLMDLEQATEDQQRHNNSRKSLPPFALAAFQSIEAGDWDPYLIRIEAAIRDRLKTEQYVASIIAGYSTEEPR